ncbi:MAG: putative short chain dehydrogenase [Streblomastix strix]|uniref:Putative short chain dehydrogenase n=2 Tax=Streblomastix strix TaxID=222440 RepID=A0A5J4WG39_9EUKA|nr:MAG: putative short chain dehydrogenase [Streblomastix strix]
MPERNLFQRYGGNSYALITGASSGIGKALAKKLAQQKMNLILVAYPDSNLENTKQQLQQLCPDIDIRTIAADFSDNPDAVSEKVIQEISNLDISTISFNAGYGCMVNSAHPTDALQNMLNTNIVTHQKLFYHLYPRLCQRIPFGEQRKRGGMFFTASMNSFFPTPFIAQYTSTKAYLGMFGSSISMEAFACGIDVVVVYPGSVRTPFQNRMPDLVVFRIVNLIGQTPESVASRELRSVGRVVIADSGFFSHITRLAFRILDENSFLFLARHGMPYISDLRRHVGWEGDNYGERINSQNNQ